MLVVLLNIREVVMSLPLERKWKFYIWFKLKKSYAEIARLYGKNESSISEVMKNKEKKILKRFIIQQMHKYIIRRYN